MVNSLVPLPDPRVQTQPQPTDQLKPLGEQLKTGRGLIDGVSTLAPDVTPITTNDAMMASLKAVMPKISGDQLDTLLLSVITKMKDAMDASEKDKIKTDTEAKRQSLQERKAKLEEATQKLAEAEAAKKGGDIWSKIKSVLMAAVAIAMLAVGALLIATGVGAPVGAALMVGGAVGLVMAADAIYAAFSPDHKGLFTTAGEKLAKSLGADNETAGWVGMAVSMTVAVVAAVITIAAGVAITVATGGLTAPAMAPMIVNSIMSCITIGMAIGDAVVAVENYKAAELTADAKKSDAESKEQDAAAKAIDDLIDMAIARLKGMSERFDAMLDAIVDNVRERGETFSRATLRAPV